MAPTELIATRRRVWALRVLAGQVGYQLRLLARSPVAAFATLVIPVMVLIAVSFLYSGVRLQSQGNILYAQFFTPAMAAFATIAACYAGVIASTVLAREQGILKRLRTTPLPGWAYLAGRIITAGLIALLGSVVIAAVGAGLYGFHVMWTSVPAALLTIAVAIFCFCSLALAVTALVPSAEAALPVAWGTLLPLCFISDVFEPIARAPHWLRALASATPVRPFADNLEALFNPVTGGSALHAGHLELMVAWGAGAALFALVAFRWEPAPGHAHHLGRREARPEPMATVDRLRELFEARGERNLDPARPITTRLLAVWRLVLVRDRDGQLEPAAGARLGGDRGVVGAGDRAGDRQAEADALRVSDALLGAGERLEQHGKLVDRDIRAGVGDREDSAVRPSRGVNPDPTVEPVVEHRVLHEVGDHPLE